MKLTIGKKIMLGCFLGLFALTLIGLLAYTGAKKIYVTSKVITKNRELNRILTQAELDHLMWGSKLIHALINSNLNKIDLEFDGRQCRFGKWLYSDGRKSIEKDAPYLTATLNTIEEPHLKLHEMARQLNEVVEKGDNKEALALYQEKTLPLVQQIIGTLDTMREKIQKNSLSDEKLAEMTFVHQRQIGWMTLIFVLALLGSSLFLRKNILGVLNKLVGDLKDASEQTTSAAAQVASASQELSEGASEQAAGIEEASSSLEQMTAMTQKNADNARQADQLMLEARKVVEDANHSMADLTDAMNGINTASEETAKIIKTIDEIAFQTNLLALNAAVEAARAGEAGAGFAVVADEVRNLAMRAADAAKNTARLIEDTVKKIRTGSEIVGKTNESFRRVAESSKTVGELVGEIAQASQEQAQGIEQVNKAISEMDRVIQRNSASAEETASAAEEMNAQAEAMRNFISELVALIQGSNGKHGQAAEAELRLLENKGRVSSLPRDSRGVSTPKRALGDTQKRKTLLRLPKLGSDTKGLPALEEASF